MASIKEFPLFHLIGMWFAIVAYTRWQFFRLPDQPWFCWRISGGFLFLGEQNHSFWNPSPAPLSIFSHSTYHILIHYTICVLICILVPVYPSYDASSMKVGSLFWSLMDSRKLEDTWESCAISISWIKGSRKLWEFWTFHRDLPYLEDSRANDEPLTGLSWLLPASLWD